MKNLKTLSFSIHIDADRQKIWRVLWNPETYDKWTRVFMEGSHYKGVLKEGTTIQFLNQDGDGMSSLVETVKENEQLVFAHQKELKNGMETDSVWQDAKEIYYLKTKNGSGTELQVVMEITPDMEDYFNNAFPKALTLVKQLTEQEL